MTNPINNLSKTKYKAVGFNLENFLFKLTSAGVALFRVKKKKQTLTFTVSSANSKVVQELASEFELKLSQVKQTGLASIFKRLPYSIGAVFGLAFSVVFVYFSVSFVTSVNYVIPQDHVCKNHENCIFLEDNLKAIKEYISQNIVIGERFAGSTKMLETSVMAKFSLVENCSIAKVGNTVTITLKEADQKEETSYTKIVAEDNCIITSITTFSGIAKVKAGDVVVKGQTLVEADGDILPRAQIQAKVFYTGMSIYNANAEILEETGESYTTTSLSAFGKTLFKAGDCPFVLFNEYVTQGYVTNWFLPIKRVTTVYKQVQIVQKYIPFEQVRESVLAKAKEDALSIAVGSPVECTYSIVTEGDITRVDCYLQVIQEIGLKV